MSRVVHPFINSRLQQVPCPMCGTLFFKYGSGKWCFFCRDIVMSEQRRESNRRYKAKKKDTDKNAHQVH